MGSECLRRFICKVEDAFQIPGRGCVVVPGLPLGGEIQARIGDGVLLKRPDGSELATTIRGFELGGGSEVAASAMLLADVTKADVPIGTEVWLS
jgi:hypothetical protein